MSKFMSPDPGVTGGTGAGETGDNGGGESNLDILDPTPEGGGAPEGGAASGGEGTPTATPPPASGLTKEDITSILENAMGRVSGGASASAKEEPTLSPEQFEQMFNVFKPNAELLTMLRSEKPEEALKALATLRDGLIRQSMTMADYRVNQLLGKMQQDVISPLQSYVTEQQALSFEQDFFKANPDLEKYRAIVDGVASKLTASGFKGSRAEIIKKYAEETRNVVKLLVGDQPAGGGGGNPSGGGTPAGGRRMANLSAGGHGGSGGAAGGKGGAGGGGNKGPAGMEVFD